MAEDDICILNDDSNGDWTEVRPPKILTYRSLSSNGSSEKSLSGFSQSQNSIYNNNNNNGRSHDELEIVDEVIRDVQPWKKKRCPIHHNIPYRERKMRFTYYRNMKSEKPKSPCSPANSSSSTSEESVFVRLFQPDLPDDDVDDSTTVLKNPGEEKAKEDPLEIVDEDCARSSRSGSPFDLVTVEGLSEQEPMENSEVDFSVSPSSHKSTRSSNVNRRSFAVMRPSVQLIDIMKHNKADSSPRYSPTLRTPSEKSGHHDNKVGGSMKKNTRKSSSDGADISSKLRSAKGSASPRSALLRTPKSAAEVSPAEEDESELEDERNIDGVINGSGTGVTENETEGRPPKRLCLFNEIINSNDYGRLVWGKTGSCRPWPAVIVNHVDCGEQKPLADKALLLWFGDHRITEVHLSRIKDFVANFGDQFARTPLTEYSQAVLECLKECRALFNLEPFSVDEEYLRWGEGGLNGVKNEIPDKKSYCSVKVQQYLRRILKMKMRERSSSKTSFFTTSSSESGDSCDQERREWKSKAGLLTQVRKGTKDIETLCIACDQVDCKVAGPHPYFFGGTCQKCKEELEDITSCAPDGSMYCLICGSPGELIVCDDGDCERVFCTGCVELFVSPKAVREIMEAYPWLCFLCNPYDKSSHGLLKPRSDWQEKTASTATVKATSIIPEVEDETPDISNIYQES